MMKVNESSQSQRPPTSFCFLSLKNVKPVVPIIYIHPSTRQLHQPTEFKHSYLIIYTLLILTLGSDCASTVWMSLIMSRK